MNFGESVAYWYLRFNGFIPMANFVLHQPNAGRRHNADADVLAVRFPHAFEEIGGREEDWDNDRFDQWNLRHRVNPVCMICEVKTGTYNRTSIRRAFSEDRLLYAVRRFGLLAADDARLVSERLLDAAVAEQGGVVFAKLLMSSEAQRVGDFDGAVPTCNIELRAALEFIKDRMRDYRREKYAARMFFPDELIQLLAWEAGVEIA